MNKEEIKRFSEEYAKGKGFRLQQDEGVLDTILGGLLRNEEQHGERYCPCRRVTGDAEQDKKIICPCIYHEQEIKEDGHCRCLLFLRK
ncbi:ferredoxin:thioredoxin reductase [Candidatus Woesearchaeota archaeon]|nr:ferredoxin:thioredoxin reductase [Candidatus Woesearchaeota archaeon]